MKPRSLILHPFEVRGILAGTLTQIRRPVKSKGPFDGPSHPAVQRIEHRGDGWFGFESSEAIKQQYVTTFPFHTIRCPLGKVGDSVVCKETWKFGSRWSNESEQGAVISYADNKTVCVHLSYDDYASISQHDGPKSRSWVDTPAIPSCRMPAWASRITLQIVSIRVERLQEISECDSESCGAQRGWYQVDTVDGEERIWTCYKDGFKSLWNSIYARRGHGWDSNPWVWVWEVSRV